MDLTQTDPRQRNVLVRPGRRCDLAKRFRVAQFIARGMFFVSSGKCRGNAWMPGRSVALWPGYACACRGPMQRIRRRAAMASSTMPWSIRWSFNRLISCRRPATGRCSRRPGNHRRSRSRPSSAVRSRRRLHRLRAWLSSASSVRMVMGAPRSAPATSTLVTKSSGYGSATTSAAGRLSGSSRGGWF